MFPDDHIHRKSVVCSCEFMRASCSSISCRPPCQQHAAITSGITLQWASVKVIVHWCYRRSWHRNAPPGEALRKISGSSADGFRKLSESSPETLRKLSGCSPEALHKLSRNSSEALRKFSGSSLEVLWKFSVRKLSGSFPDAVQNFSGNFLKAFRMLP